jgi:hypothetical protein
MSILGLTIDYGPYGWLEDYDPLDAKHYRCHGPSLLLRSSPQIAQWNLAQLANALFPLIGETGPLEEPLREYSRHFELAWQTMMAQKLGLSAFRPATDQSLGNRCFNCCPCRNRHDHFFPPPGRGPQHVENHQDRITPYWGLLSTRALTDAYRRQLADWLEQYARRLDQESLPEKQRMERMNRVNPNTCRATIWRNWLSTRSLKGSIPAFGNCLRSCASLRRPARQRTVCAKTTRVGSPPGPVAPCFLQFLNFDGLEKGKGREVTHCKNSKFRSSNVVLLFFCEKDNFPWHIPFHHALPGFWMFGNRCRPPGVSHDVHQQRLAGGLF